MAAASRTQQARHRASRVCCKEPTHPPAHLVVSRVPLAAQTQHRRSLCAPSAIPVCIVESVVFPRVWRALPVRFWLWVLLVFAVVWLMCCCCRDVHKHARPNVVCQCHSRLFHVITWPKFAVAMLDGHVLVHARRHRVHKLSARGVRTDRGHAILFALPAFALQRRARTAAVLPLRCRCVVVVVLFCFVSYSCVCVQARTQTSMARKCAHSANRAAFLHRAPLRVPHALVVRFLRRKVRIDCIRAADR